MTPPPTISVVIPSYNRWPFVGEAVESVLAQTYPRTEVVLVDDGSTDGTADRVESQFPEVIVVRQPNGERGAARNNGVRSSTGEYVTFLDSDDRFEPTHLAAVAAAFETTRAEAVITSASMWNPESGATWPLRSSLPDGPLTTNAALWGNPVPIICLTVTRSLFERLGGFPEERDIAGSEDWVLVLSLIASTPITRVPRGSAWIRHHAGRSMADPHVMIRSRRAAAAHILEQGVASRPISTVERRRLIAGTEYFCATNHYLAGDMQASREALREVRRELGPATGAATTSRLWLQTWLGEGPSRRLRNVRDAALRRR